MPEVSINNAEQVLLQYFKQANLSGFKVIDAKLRPEFREYKASELPALVVHIRNIIKQNYQFNYQAKVFIFASGRPQLAEQECVKLTDKAINYICNNEFIKNSNAYQLQFESAEISVSESNGNGLAMAVIDINLIHTL